MFESRSARWFSNSSRVRPGLTSRSPVACFPKEETSMARPIRLCLFLFLILVATLGISGLVAPSTAEAKKVVNIAAKEPDTLDPHSSTLGQSQETRRVQLHC